MWMCVWVGVRIQAFFFGFSIIVPLCIDVRAYLYGCMHGCMYTDAGSCAGAHVCIRWCTTVCMYVSMH